jgi:hypothetical protein
MPFRLRIPITREYLAEILDRAAKANPPQRPGWIVILFSTPLIVGLILAVLPIDAAKWMALGMVVGWAISATLALIGGKLDKGNAAAQVHERMLGTLEVTISDEGIHTVTPTTRALRSWRNVSRAARFPDGTSIIYIDGASLWLPDSGILAPHNGEGLFNFVQFHCDRVREELDARFVEGQPIEANLVDTVPSEPPPAPCKPR